MTRGARCPVVRPRARRPSGWARDLRGMLSCSSRKSCHEAEARREGPRDDGIEQLREILFGAIVHDIDRRIARTDAHHVAGDQER